MMGRVDPAFWSGRRVLLTGNTGFKGAWAGLWLARMGAEVHGFAKAPESPSLFDLAAAAADVACTTGDVRDARALAAAVAGSRPQVVLHFAAQALVRRAYREPAETFETNVQGTVNLMQSVSHLDEPAVVLVATTDKVYRNGGSGAAFDEDDALGGNDPYSASKVAQEMVAQAYGNMLVERGTRVVTARAGNVIGGGDFAEDRLVPDLVRAAGTGTMAVVRNPDATRPFQHVLDCLAGYFLYVQEAAENASLPRSLNFGPEGGSTTVRALATAVCDALGHGAGWQAVAEKGPKEAPALTLDSSRARKLLHWRETWPGAAAIDLTASWYRDFAGGKDMRQRCLADIDRAMASAS